MFVNNLKIKRGPGCFAHPILKFVAYSTTHIVTPIAVKTLGPWNGQWLSFISELGRCISLITRDPRETSYLLHRISVAVQRDDAESCVGSLPPNECQTDG